MTLLQKPVCVKSWCLSRLFSDGSNPAGVVAFSSAGGVSLPTTRSSICGHVALGCIKPFLVQFLLQWRQLLSKLPATGLLRSPSSGTLAEQACLQDGRTLRQTPGVQYHTTPYRTSPVQSSRTCASASGGDTHESCSMDCAAGVSAGRSSGASRGGPLTAATTSNARHSLHPAGGRRGPRPGALSSLPGFPDLIGSCCA